MPTFVLADEGMPIIGIVLIIVGGVLLIAACIFLAIHLYLRKFKVTSKNLRATYENCHNLLTVDCNDMIQRIQTLGKSNAYFQSVYEERKKSYDDILNRKDKDMLNQLDTLDLLIKQKKYQEYKNSIADCNGLVDSFEHAVCNFNTELTSILQDDNDIRNNAVAVKAKYRKIKEFYEGHLNELKMLSKSFDKLLNHSEAQFAAFDECINKAEYDQAKEILTKLEKLLDATLAVMDQFPLLASSVSYSLPKKAEEMSNEYQEMLAQDYVIQYLKVPQLLDSIQEDLAKLTKQLLRFDVNGVKEKISSITASIVEMQTKFAEEKEAKEKFLANQNILAESSFAIEKRYAKMINMLSQYQATYILDEKYVTQMIALKGDIEAISYLKRELDSCLDTTERKPYVVIFKTMGDMNAKIQKVSAIMNDYSDYLNSLKKDSNFVYYGLRDCYINLKVSQRMVREIGVDAYTNAVKQSFGDLYSQIEIINNMVMTTPINVKKALSLFTPFKESVDGLKASVENTKKEADMAEAKIVEANAYRVDYRDCRDSLVDAEKYFNEAEFDKAYRITENSLKIYASPKVEK